MQRCGRSRSTPGPPPAGASPPTRGSGSRCASSAGRGARTVNPDFLDLLAALVRAKTRFLVVGAHALAAHGVPRATGDLDVWIQPDPENARRVREALLDFGAPAEALGLPPADLAAPGLVFQLGAPPRRIDVLTAITGVAFDDAWSSRSVHRVGEIDVPFVPGTGRADLQQARNRPDEGSRRRGNSRTARSPAEAVSGAAARYPGCNCARNRSRSRATSRRMRETPAASSATRAESRSAP